MGTQSGSLGITPPGRGCLQKLSLPSQLPPKDVTSMKISKGFCGHFYWGPLLGTNVLPESPLVDRMRSGTATATDAPSTPY